ncbi:hypothetical protein BVRB_4g093840 [Beta vulgaris subsp. vulgaris]|uniref:uncharacterized protein LOC104907307 n=1 Tax=Beta vulgaris subsp. vulgaris TaxID=3555 RepID=UPI00053FBB79|nr:uncharacterized protein LOC104907307 [Beta vulgaris subsp. vulgaris]KMS98317.1 hypothetical protein BVRB_4g093840 [Beta vulgaris subsp. vulgaris]
MPKGDDFRAKKKNKAIRKKLAKDPSSVSARVAGIIAAKKRRQSGKRRQCQGMCFSLPTPQDPYNERHGKEDNSTSKIKRLLPQSNKKGTSKNVANGQQNLMLSGDQVNIDIQKAKRSKHFESEKIQLGEEDFQCLGAEVLPMDLEDCTLGNSSCPSKFLCSCLNSIRDSLLGVGVLNKEQDKPLFVDSWGVDFWKSYSLGIDILENSGTSPSVQQMAWVASTAADSISQKESDGISITTPFLLYLVPSQEKASKVRSVCKPLKLFGIHTVSLHPGAPVEHQVEGLKSCEPEFLIATPERLRELVSLKAVDISGVSLLVVDGLDLIPQCLDAVKGIKNSISGKPCTMIFQGPSGGSNIEAIESILRKPFHTLSINEPRNSQGIRSICGHPDI